MQTISVAIAVYNEEKNLKDCLESIRDLAHEIVIVDGSSIDKTVEIAEEYGAKIEITTNKSNFHINKQKAIDLATKDWILQLDADERVTPELIKEIKSEIRNPRLPKPGTGGQAKSEINGYWIPRKNWFLGRFLLKGGQYPDYTLRLYRRGKGRLPQKDVHEQARVEGNLGYLSTPLLHYPYQNFLSFIYKWNRYNDILSEQIKENLNNKNFLSKIGYAIGYLIVKPFHWFLTTYIRHKGFMDLWPGFVFSFFSSLRFPVSYLKYIMHK
jgi:glycosyltransferase involved in cell wall biosynthesis